MLAAAALFGLATASSAGSASRTTVTSFRSGEFWQDTAGEIIDAHGAGLLQHEDKYFWYGSKRTKNATGTQMDARAGHWYSTWYEYTRSSCQGGTKRREHNADHASAHETDRCEFPELGVLPGAPNRWSQLSNFGRETETTAVFSG